MVADELPFAAFLIQALNDQTLVSADDINAFCPALSAGAVYRSQYHSDWAGAVKFFAFPLKCMVFAVFTLTYLAFD